MKSVAVDAQGDIAIMKMQRGKANVLDLEFSQEIYLPPRVGFCLFGVVALCTLFPLSAVSQRAQSEIRVLRDNQRTVAPAILDRGRLLGGVPFQQVAGASRLADGIVVVADRGNNEISFFDSLGRRLASFGRKGGGPGEFNQIANVVRLRGDTIAVFDLRHRRISLFTRHGFIRDYPLQTPSRANPPPSLGDVYSGLPDDGLLFWLQTIPRNDADIRRLNEPYTVAQIPVVLFASDAMGRGTKVVGEYAGEDKYLGRMGTTPVNMGAAPFGAWTRFGVAHGRVYVFRNADREIRVFSPVGQHVLTYRLSWPARRVNAADRRAYLVPRLERETRFRESLEKMPFPREMPFYRSVYLGTDATIWLEPYYLWDGKRQLVGFDSLGVGGRRMTLAENDRILEVGKDWAIVLSVDPLGVETVRIHRFSVR